MKLCIFEVEDWERDTFEALAAEHDLKFTDQPLTAKNASQYAEAEGISIFIYSKIDQAVLINTARGEVVDVRALVHALADGKIAAAGLDVLPNEPVVREEAELLRAVYEQHHDLSTLLADEVLVHMRNVVVTPHSAFNTREAVQRILDTTVENLRTFAQGEPTNAVARQ
ncbi:NAD(P)-dependent oxidoreductase [Nitrosococcus wardiae]|nr:NAD(P)-dependent oxidoreductase [Nitrosococcus wardiae]